MSVHRAVEVVIKDDLDQLHTFTGPIGWFRVSMNNTPGDLNVNNQWEELTVYLRLTPP